MRKMRTLLAIVSLLAGCDMKPARYTVRTPMETYEHATVVEFPYRGSAVIRTEDGRRIEIQGTATFEEERDER